MLQKHLEHFVMTSN